MKIVPVIVISVVALSVIGGFFIVGSPTTERVRRFDERRIGDLQNIQWEIINYWQKKNQLPQALPDLRDDIRGFVLPTDPETALPYEYTANTVNSFSLCAVFSMANDSAQGITKPLGRIGRETESWRHDAGRTCFTRTIDADLYPPVGTKPTPVIQYNN